MKKEITNNKTLLYADMLDKLGNDAQRENKYQEAESYYEEALTIRKEIYRWKDHNSIANSYNNLGNLYQRQKNYVKAEVFFKKALDIQKKIFSEYHTLIARSLNNLGLVYQYQGNYKKAEEFLKKALDIREKKLEKEHIDVANSCNFLATFYRALGDKEKEQYFSQRALAISEKLQAENEHLKQQEREQRIALEESKKLNYLSYMASGVAHNINNPVGILRLAAQRGLKALEKGELTNETGQEIFQRILKQADRLHDIIEKFREFARGDRKQVENIDLNAIVSQVKEYFASQLDTHKITLQIELSPDNPQALANNFILQEILINLISNARDALETINNAQILIKTWKNVETVGFSVCDNGTGISEEQQKNLFSPFHSTKAHGTGLGLHFVKKSLEELKGNIDYQDNIPQGACFNIELPIGNN
ncbi:histidine kinase,tetratricopeptide repeat protein,histidine kinase [Beggiatoa alba B18LD]|uniref:histidine kinase n=1 Tax=Beggiatoa alba B18LD TaxID=395493 RepID=I3CCJ2_9GAMM|nr:tetratricopeptide repeat protein [Beggiatoa alba]EIJ41335.1 histidine kinase,tetratricopeptide repeat protein,histidine kinase [Beggiatoa alba B18LD]